MQINSAKIFQYMPGTKDVQLVGVIVQYVLRQQKEEPIRGLISWDFIFFKRGMLTILIIGPNKFQVAVCAKC